MENDNKIVSEKTELAEREMNDADGRMKTAKMEDSRRGH